jgi:hypothetical protein
MECPSIGVFEQSIAAGTNLQEDFSRSPPSSQLTAHPGGFPGIVPRCWEKVGVLFPTCVKWKTTSLEMLPFLWVGSRAEDLAAFFFPEIEITRKIHEDVHSS